MNKTVKNYVLTFINYKGERAIASKRAEEVSLDVKPFFVSYENAEKEGKKLQKKLQKTHIDQYSKHWHDKVMEARAKGEVFNDNSTDEKENLDMDEKMVKNYQDHLLMLENGFEVREVTISVDLS